MPIGIIKSITVTKSGQSYSGVLVEVKSDGSDGDEYAFSQKTRKVVARTETGALVFTGPYLSATKPAIGRCVHFQRNVGNFPWRGKFAHQWGTIAQLSGTIGGSTT